MGAGSKAEWRDGGGEEVAKIAQHPLANLVKRSYRVERLRVPRALS